MIKATLLGLTADSLADYPGPLRPRARPPNTVSRFDNEDLSRLAAAEAWAARHPEVNTRFRPGANSTPRSLIREHCLVGIRPGRYDHVKVDAPPEEDLGYCPECERTRRRVFQPSGATRLQFQRDDAPALFHAAHCALYASDAMVDALRAAGMGDGLNAVPVEATGTSRRWFWVHPSTTLRLPPQPFGPWRESCTSCDQRYDRYKAIPIFEDPAAVDWFTFPGWIDHASVGVRGEPAQSQEEWDQIQREVERGLYRSMPEALASDHDIVYTLDLTAQPIHQLFGDDLAKLVNLNALLIAHTRIHAVPDQVASLANLTEIDLRGTPNAEAEGARLRALLGERSVTIRA